MCFGRGSVDEQDGERLLFATLAFTEPSHRGVVQPVHQQLKAAHALQRQNAAFLQIGDRTEQGFPAARHATTFGIPKLQLGTAARASDGLRMKAPIGQRRVLALAILTRRKVVQGGGGAIVR